MKVGDYIRKENYTSVLGSGYPVIKIKGITKNSINGVMISENQRKTFVVISEEEAISLMEKYNSSIISSIPVADKTFVCKREDNGQPKVPIDVFRIKEVWFHYYMLNPAISAYCCPKCGYYHLGKLKEG